AQGVEALARLQAAKRNGRELFAKQPALPTLTRRKCLLHLLLQRSATSTQPPLQPALPALACAEARVPSRALSVRACAGSEVSRPMPAPSPIRTYTKGPRSSVACRFTTRAGRPPPSPAWARAAPLAATPPLAPPQPMPASVPAPSASWPLHAS